MITDKILKIDLSFIPNEAISDELKNFSTAPIIYPYSEENILDEINKGNIDVKQATELMKKANDYKANYWALERALLELGESSAKIKNYSLAETIFKYLLSIGSKVPNIMEGLIKIYLENNDKDRLTWIFEKIDEQLNENKEHYYSKTELNALKIKYGKHFFTNDQIWASFNKQLSNSNNFYEHSNIYNQMGLFLLKEGKRNEAVHKFILSYLAEFQYSFILDQSFNSNNCERYKKMEFVSGRVKTFLKKAKLELYTEAISKLIVVFLSKFPKTDMKELKNNLAQILKNT